MFIIVEAFHINKKMSVCLYYIPKKHDLEILINLNYFSSNYNFLKKVYLMPRAT